jgi:hypothetical protein
MAARRLERKSKRWSSKWQGIIPLGAMTGLLWPSAISAAGSRTRLSAISYSATGSLPPQNEERTPPGRVLSVGTKRCFGLQIFSPQRSGRGRDCVLFFIHLSSRRVVLGGKFPPLSSCRRRACSMSWAELCVVSPTQKNIPNTIPPRAPRCRR